MKRAVREALKVGSCPLNPAACPHMRIVCVGVVHDVMMCLKVCTDSQVTLRQFRGKGFVRLAANFASEDMYGVDRNHKLHMLRSVPSRGADDTGG